MIRCDQGEFLGPAHPGAVDRFAWRILSKRVIRSIRLFSLPARLVAASLVCWLAGTLAVASAQPTLKDAVGRILDGPAAAPDANVDAPPTPRPSRPTDDLDRQTPRGAVAGFLDVAREGKYDVAAEYLFLGNLPQGLTSDDGPLLARQFKTILDRTLWVDVPALSRETEGHTDDELPEGRDWVGRIQTKSGPVEVFVQRIRLPGGERLWKFSSLTVAQIPAMYAEFGDGPLANILPPIFFDVQLFDLQLWQAVGIVALAVAAYLLSLLGTSIVGWIFRRLPDELTTRLSPFIVGPLRLLITVLLFAAARRSLNLPIHVGSVLGAIESLLRIIAFTWAGLRLLDVVTSRMMDRLVVRRQASALALVPPVRRIAQIFIVSIGLVVALGAVGLNATALVAGLGVGGIAVALAAQKSIEHLFGGATLYADQPVKVGDFCRFGDKTGTIEQIGLRSTRVRTLDRTLLTIPNGEFSNLQIENYSKRDKFRFYPRLSLRYETSPDQMRFVLIEIRKLLYQHPKVDIDPCRVRFSNFGAFSLDVDVLAYVLAEDIHEYLAVAEDLNLRIMEIVTEAGAGFAFPSQTVYFENGTPPDPELKARAEETVRRWREDNTLYVTEFPQEKIAEIFNTLTYPPNR